MLGLVVPTDDDWVRLALADLPRILVDHAHCEMKAATNAMSLVTRYPDDMPLVVALTALAQEELLHFSQAVGFLRERGLALGPPLVDEYAAMLRAASTKLPERHIERHVLVDRLLIGALIEARSCERFKLLCDALAANPENAELHAFYNELFICEARHYRTYVDLAVLASHGPRDVVEARLARLAQLEGAIVKELAANNQRAMIHG